MIPHPDSTEFYLPITGHETPPPSLTSPVCFETNSLLLKKLYLRLDLHPIQSQVCDVFNDLILDLYPLPNDEKPPLVPPGVVLDRQRQQHGETNKNTNRGGSHFFMFHAVRCSIESVIKTMNIDRAEHGRRGLSPPRPHRGVAVGEVR